MMRNQQGYRMKPSRLAQHGYGGKDDNILVNLVVHVYMTEGMTVILMKLYPAIINRGIVPCIQTRSWWKRIAYEAVTSEYLQTIILIHEGTL
jgi:hypothetical protein